MPMAQRSPMRASVLCPESGFSARESLRSLFASDPGRFNGKPEDVELNYRGHFAC